MKKVCLECGLEFETNNGNKKFCDRQHYRICKICGKKYPINRYHLTAKDAKTTCSRKCSAELRKQTNIEKYGGVAPACSEEVRSKMESTMEARYGVKHYAQSEDGLNKIKKTNLKRYGVVSYLETERVKQRNQELWANEAYVSSVRSKIESTNLERYGIRCLFSDKDFRNKCKLSYIEKTGYAHPFQNPEVKQELKSNSLKKYGTEHPNQSEEVKEKIKASLQLTFSDERKKKEILEKRMKTSQERYGVPFYMQTQEGKEKVSKSIFDRFGVYHITKTKDWKQSVISDPSKSDYLLEFDSNPELFISKYFKDKPTLMEVANLIGVSGTEAVSLRVHREHIEDQINYVYSQMEHSVYSFLKSLDNELRIERNTHQIITPYELDLYLPDYQLAIECNPISTHNSSINTWDESADPVHYKYHQMKTNLCEEKGIFLFHLFGYEWTYHSDIIKSMLSNLLGMNKEKIYGRKTSIIEVDSKTANLFLEQNHRQGSTNSNIRLGLLYEGELVSIMTFGKMRKGIGLDSSDLSNCWELVRFCSKLNTSVIGGASKLFKYFIDKHSPKQIRSFSDRAHTKGNLYKQLGFKEIRRSDPGYLWVNLSTEKAFHRYNAQKQNIRNFLKDDSIDLTKTEKQIMEEHGFVQLFDSGTITWEWNSKS